VSLVASNGRSISDADWHRAVNLCNELSAEVRRLKRQRSALRKALRLAMGEAEKHGVGFGPVIHAMAKVGAR
jgi:hypothetical protein